MQIEIKVSGVWKRSFKSKTGETVNYAVVSGITSDGDRVEISASAENLPKEGASCRVGIKEAKRVMLGVYKIRGVLE